MDVGEPRCFEARESRFYWTPRGLFGLYTPVILVILVDPGHSGLSGGQGEGKDQNSGFRKGQEGSGNIRKGREGREGPEGVEPNLERRGDVGGWERDWCIGGLLGLLGLFGIWEMK